MMKIAGISKDKVNKLFLQLGCEWAEDFECTLTADGIEISAFCDFPTDDGYTHREERVLEISFADIQLIIG